MATLNIKGLVRRLTPTCQRTLQAGAGLCLFRTNYNVEIEHWLFKLSEGTDTDLHLIYRHFNVDISRLQKQLTTALDKLKTGNARTPALSPQVLALAREGWLLASVEFGAKLARSGHLLAALLLSDELGPAVRDVASELDKINAETLKKDLPGIIQSSSESAEMMSGAASEESSAGGVASPTPGTGGALSQFCIDLTERAKAGKIDPVLGRDAEVRQIVDILMRRRQNNPILTGEAGVGKTAVVEGLANRIVGGDVPPPLQKVRLLTLDLGLLQAGAGMKGEFESRLRSVIDEVRASPVPIILFIDEAHTMIGAGGQAGQGDAANLLKPALARGELRTIAATTWAEYKKYFEKDPALARRFQVVKVEEPTEPVAIQMMRGLVGTLEAHHGVRILDEAIQESVRLSHRYIAGRQLPDKSVSLLDTACARVAIGNHATPPAVEDCRRRIDQLGVAIEVLQREAAVGASHGDRLTELTTEREASTAELAKLEKRLAEERRLISEIRSCRAKLEPTTTAIGAKPIKSDNPPISDAEREQTLEKLAALNVELKKVQGQEPLMQVCVDGQAIAEVVSAWTGIPVGRMISDEIKTVLNLRQTLEKRIIGQGHALDAIAQAIRTSRANMTDPRKPIGVFLMVGTSGVGKTETAVALAELLYGGDQNMTIINMSEFKEEHKVSLLMGSPPGYVGYGEGGVLTEAVRRKPYSVVLLDEMEKAHPGVQDIFFQVFDKGMMKDGEGRDIDFKNTVIIMTSNAATDMIMKLCADPDTRPEPEALAELLHPELTKTFKPAFLGRVNIVPYYPLPDDVMRKIIELKLGSVVRRVKENYKAAMTFSPEVVDAIANRCKEVHTGGRNVDHILNKTLLPEMSAEFLSRMAEGAAIASVHVDVNPDKGFTYQIQ